MSRASSATICLFSTRGRTILSWYKVTGKIACPSCSYIIATNSTRLLGRQLPDTTTIVKIHTSMIRAEVDAYTSAAAWAVRAILQTNVLAIGLNVAVDVKLCRRAGRPDADVTGGVDNERSTRPIIRRPMDHKFSRPLAKTRRCTSDVPSNGSTSSRKIESLIGSASAQLIKINITCLN